jgi:hypothetical protein
VDNAVIIPEAEDLFRIHIATAVDTEMGHRAPRSDILQPEENTNDDPNLS